MRRKFLQVTVTTPNLAKREIPLSFSLMQPIRLKHTPYPGKKVVSTAINAISNVPDSINRMYEPVGWLRPMASKWMHELQHTLYALMIQRILYSFTRKLLQICITGLKAKVHIL